MKLRQLDYELHRMMMMMDLEFHKNPDLSNMTLEEREIHSKARVARDSIKEYFRAMASYNTPIGGENRAKKEEKEI